MLKKTAVATVFALSALGASAAVTVDVGDVATPGNFEFASLVSGTFDLGGYRIGYSPTSHNGSRFVDLTVLGRDGRVLR